MSWLKENIEPLLAIGLVGGAGALMLLRPNLETAMGQVIMAIVGYYFGSSVGSRMKDRIIRPEKIDTVPNPFLPDPPKDDQVG